jgi:hypothetical protein
MIDATRALLFTSRSLELFYLVPLASAWMNQRSIRYQREPWMPALVVTIAFNVLIRAVLLGTAMAGIRNHWVSNLAFLPNYLLMTWVISGFRVNSRTRPALLIAALPVAALAFWEASQVGLNSVWNNSATLAAVIFLAATLVEIHQLFLLDTTGTLGSIPGFWVATAWALDNGISLIFHSLFDFFLQTLSKPWILVPWLVVFLLGAFFNLFLARAFLCLKPQSS